jgi:hypothetical protein
MINNVAGQDLTRNAIQNAVLLQYTAMVDNLARTYANAQGLQLTTQSDFPAWLFQFMNALCGYIGLISILNGDGFNDRVTQLCQQLTNFRSRIQTGYERLASMPFPPGLIDIAVRCCGLFASYMGGDCYLHYPNFGASGTPFDLTSSAAITTFITGIEAQVAALQTQAENGIVRIVLAEYFGDPVPLPFPGVRVCRSLYDQFRVVAIQNIATTNVFASPYILNTSAAGNPGNVPVLVPKGYENDPLWYSLFRVKPWAGFNNVVKADAAMLGLFNDSAGVSSTIRYYLEGSSTSTVENVTNAVLNGYATVGNEFYFAPQPANSDITGYSTDFRTQNDFTLFNVSWDYILNQTIRGWTDILTGKMRIPYPPDCVDFNNTKLKGPYQR